MTAYCKVTDGEVVHPCMKGYKMGCCDCGLVHRIDFFVIKHGRGHKVRLIATRDVRATAAVRREKRKRESR
jgi:hypothetical protein